MAHGRGSGAVDWKEQGVDQKRSENIWIAMLGPDTPALGERANIAPIEQAQIGATVCCRHSSPDQVEPYIDTS
jgi:hypothetical protein